MPWLPYKASVHNHGGVNIAVDPRLPAALRSKLGSPSLATPVLIPIQSEANMNSDYVFLCGVMWCKFGQPDAGRELVRATQCEDPYLSALAHAMFQEGCSCFHSSDE